MGLNKIELYYGTLKQLRFKQVYYQVYYRLRKVLPESRLNVKKNKNSEPLHFGNSICSLNSYLGDGKFSFLNIEKLFEEGYINWNFSEYGKLWTYNLNYFDFLNQEDFDVNMGVSLIKDFIKKNNSLKDGLEPYPISLRGINWIKFLSKYSIEDEEISDVLYQHYIILTKNIEYHLLANHLLENAFSLYFGAYFFKDKQFYRLANKILVEELNEQILDDGAHFELSPMYHQILLFRLLDCINLSNSNEWDSDSLLLFLKGKAIMMLEWLEAITYSNGNIPMVNDSTYNIAPKSVELFSYAKALNIDWKVSKLSDSGYRRFSNEKYELFCDVGNIGPKYQPGHAHSDTLNFELYVDGKPIIVDTGISTYEKNDLRQLQRSTTSHNTVKIGDSDQSQVWGGFRVGRRAKIIYLNERDDFVEASHDGYKNLGLIHTRSFEVDSKSVIITDHLSKPSPLKKIAYLHFYPNISSIEILENEIKILDSQISVKIHNALRIDKEIYEYALGFNLKKQAIVVKILFDLELKIRIHVL